MDEIIRVSLKCKSCNGTMEVDPEREILSCPYCGSRDLLVESDAVRIEQIKSQTKKDIELGRSEYKLKMKELSYKKFKFEQLLPFTIFGIMIVLLVLWIVIDSIGKVTVGCSYKSLKDKNYEDVVDILEGYGFTDIDTISQEDLVTGWIDEEFTVDYVSIDGDNKFQKGDTFDKDAVVKVYYHSFKEDKKSTKK